MGISKKLLGSVAKSAFPKKHSNQITDAVQITTDTKRTIIVLADSQEKELETHLESLQSML